MTEEHVTDGERVAQLLASELSGRSDGALARVSVVDADRDATPTSEGVVAYGVAVDGERVGDVRMYPESVEIRTVAGRDPFDVDEFAAAVTGPGLSVESTTGETLLRTEYGAAVKRAVDALVAAVEP
jgi:hypothetical protein